MDDKPYSRGTATCPLCREKAHMERYIGKASPPFPKNWWVDMVHDHSQEKPGWVVVVYYREPGGRFPQPAKLIREEQKAQRKREIAEKRAENAGKPGTKNRSN